ncbi:PfkB family carbohydrate kinase [uncultured Cellulomonas sp.]|uniref:PfkB family carbohydrate kinase n=1 Tax=uncultured Cellulomonas sp. TaxID=189682 RepID=UPI002613291E|nr:PfkB family carbohydrate kinase [uncultured Cellulomonas sp.]
MSDVAVVGSVNVDVVVRVPHLPGPGQTLLASGLTRGAGGKGANQAVAAARAGGAATAFVGVVGRDDDGAVLRTALADAGVVTDALSESDEPTGTALICVSDDGENVIVVVGGANAGWQRLSAAQRAAVAAADVVLAQLEVPVDVVLQAAAVRRPAARFVLNAAPARELPAALWAAVDVLVVNEHEARDLADGVPLADALAVLGSRVPALVVTLGAAGCTVVVDGERTDVPGTPVAAVDTTGAGDTFCGVLAARLAAGDDLVEAARWGGAAASLAVQRPGAQAAIPTAAQTRRVRAAGAGR